MLQGSPAEKRDLFSGSSASRFGEAGLRIPLHKLGAAVSPTSEPRKDNILPQSQQKRPHGHPQSAVNLMISAVISPVFIIPVLHYSISPEEHRRDL
ncbi:MAG: hypothetical protein JSV55_13955 [Deltaproteobacteria bacterium]|nr:MAG: hypothetical protein JSV55_13955 [Deltaproteobacteria bacterium]